MTAISGTRRQMQELADGTIRVKIDIDPAFKKQFQEMFPDIDMPVALAPLVAQFEQTKPLVVQTPSDMSDYGAGEPDSRFTDAGSIPSNSTELSQKYRVLACQLCKNKDFQQFIEVSDEESARAHILSLCDIASRRELDTDVAASYIFERLRKDFRALVESRK